MISHPEPLTTPAQIQEMADKLRERDIIAFDTEFIRESTFYPVVEIIQVATADESWLVDAQAFRPRTPSAAGLKPLMDVFEDPKILKVIHAAQGDQECIYTAWGSVASPSIDTAVAASLCGYGDGVGLGNLLKAVLNVTIKKGHARTNWAVRPLPEQLIEYAHADVAYLVALGQKLLEELDAVERRPWALEASAKWEDKSLYEPDPEGIAQKLSRSGRFDRKGYAALVELVRWREERVRQLNVPRRWVADDNVLTDLAHVRPKDIAHLSAFRGLNKGELRNSGEAILNALKKAVDVPETAPARGPRPDIPSASESQVLELLRCYVGILADRHKIALKHLVTAAQLLPLLRTEATTPEGLASEGLLDEGASRLIGAEVLAFIQGKRALSVDGNKIKIVEL